MKPLAADIEYLSFEGGGGAGNAYPGALFALEGLAILKYDSQRVTLAPEASLDLTTAPVGIDWLSQGQIKGISGASAGAINALFLSLGYTPTEIEHILRKEKFDTFFDDIIPGLSPRVGGFRLEPATYDLAGFYEEFSATTAGAIFNVLLGGNALGEAIDFREWASTTVGTVMGSQWTALLDLCADFPETLAERFISDLNTGKDFASLAFDFGIFPGLEIRKFFARYVSLAVERVMQNNPKYNLKAPSAGTYGPVGGVDAGFGISFYDAQTNADVRTSEITFRQHEQIFGTKLLVTGSNLETQKSHFFSADVTPNFRIVDAVRISMSLPLLFKPMIIKDDADLKAVVNPGEPLADHYLKGVWVDGGLLNNIPVASFDLIAGGSGHTLGLVVGPDKRSEIDSIFGFLGVYPLGLGIGGTGGSQLSATTSDLERIILLNTYDPRTDKEIRLLDFTVGDGLYSNINEQSAKTVRDFFGP